MAFTIIYIMRTTLFVRAYVPILIPGNPFDPEFTTKLQQPRRGDQGSAMHQQSLMASLLLSIAVAAVASGIGADEHNPVAHEPRIRGNAGKPRLSSSSCARTAPALPSPSWRNGTDRTAALAKRTGLTLGLKREISDLMLASTVELGDASAAQVLERLRADPAVEYVSLDRRRFPHATTPNDSLFANQWYLQEHRGLRGQRHRRLGPRTGLHGRRHRRARHRCALRPSGSRPRRPRRQAVARLRFRERRRT